MARSCLVTRYPVIHVWGDSNSRRMLKSLGLINWCTDAFAKCNCEDRNESGPEGVFKQDQRVSRITMGVGMDLKGVEEGEVVESGREKVTVLFEFIGGMGVPNFVPWRERMRLEAERHPYRTDERHPRLVLVNVGNWDVGGVTEDPEGPEDWERNANELVDRMKEYYAAASPPPR
ncbi:hypothetical protein HDU98_002858, partial [Podochytrium sp. JEL0797]